MITLRLSIANLKKKKGASFTFIVFILLAVALMNIGISLINQMGHLYEQKEAELNSAQFVAMSSANSYKKEYEEFVFQDDRVSLAEKEDVIYMPNTKNNKNKLEFGAALFNKDRNRQISPLIPLEEDDSIPKDKAIYVPIMMKGDQVCVGDDYVITYKGKTYSFIIAGFFETTYYGSIGGGLLKFFIPEESFNVLYAEIGRATILSARFKDLDTNIQTVSEKFARDFTNVTGYKSISEGSVQPCLSAAFMKSGYTMFIGIAAAILVAFTLVVCIIIMAVIHHRIVESLSESMQSIGVLLSMGYTTKQIMISIILEYQLLSVAGYMFGILLSYSSVPIMRNYLLSAGLTWEPGIHIGVDILCFVIILSLISLTAFLGSTRMLKIAPVQALSKTMNRNQSKKNVCPLHKGSGSVHYRIALKNLLFHKKANISFSLIIAGGIFAMGLSMVMFLMFGLDNSAIMDACGFELSDFQISVTANADVESFSKELLKMEEVRKTNLSTLTTVKLEQDEIQVIVSDNFDAMEVLQTYEGELPRYNNEIVITGVLSKKFNKSIGDTVTVTTNGRSQDFYVTGIYQTSNNNGYMSILHLDGIKAILPQFVIRQIDVYLKEGVDKEMFKEKLRIIYKVAVNEYDVSTDSDISQLESEKYAKAAKIADEKIAKLLTDYGVNSISYSVMLDGEIILSGDSSAYKINEISDLRDYLDAQLNSFGSVMGGIVTMIIIITFLIIGGVLSMTVKSQIRAKRQEYGIYKAMGYTTKNLVYQLSLSYAFTSLFGTIIGSVATFFYASNILQLVFINMGLTRLNIKVNPVPILIMDCCMVVFIYVITMVKAYSIKKITAYDLLTE